MQTRIVEATNGFNWGKFLLGRFDDAEWAIRSEMAGAGAAPLLHQVGMSRDQLLVLDLQTCEGALFSVRPSGHARSDLNKHRVWVCPMFEPFLEWLYFVDVSDLSELPALVELPHAPAEFAGYRRAGVEEVPCPCVCHGAWARYTCHRCACPSQEERMNGWGPADRLDP